MTIVASEFISLAQVMKEIQTGRGSVTDRRTDGQDEPSIPSTTRCGEGGIISCYNITCWIGLHSMGLNRMGRVCIQLLLYWQNSEQVGVIHIIFGWIWILSAVSHAEVYTVILWLCPYLNNVLKYWIVLTGGGTWSFRVSRNASTSNCISIRSKESISRWNCSCSSNTLGSSNCAPHHPHVRLLDAIWKC